MPALGVDDREAIPALRLHVRFEEHRKRLVDDLALAELQLGLQRAELLTAGRRDGCFQAHVNTLNCEEDLGEFSSSCYRLQQKALRSAPRMRMLAPTRKCGSSPDVQRR